MKRKHLFLALAALLVAGALWFARTTWRTHASENSSAAALESPETPDGQSRPGQMNNSRPRHAPPNPIQRFKDFTPEQRVQQARKGHGPGG